MGREIKFRAWDIEWKTMCFGIIGQDRWYSKTGFLDVSSGGLEGCEIMQYTGLKDKSGNEIYEGDILKEDKRGLFYKVFSVAGGFAINTHQDDFKNESVYFYESIGDMQTAGYIESNCAVIGNIHQHKHLLS